MKRMEKSLDGTYALSTGQKLVESTNEEESQGGCAC